jgi:hypothetical protein
MFQLIILALFQFFTFTHQSANTTVGGSGWGNGDMAVVGGSGWGNGDMAVVGGSGWGNGDIIA